MPEIGETLRDARMRARIDVSEIEAKTKIRAKYLRALENEEWGLLPGPTFVKSFLRTYAQALGLDGKALVEEYRLSHEHPSEAALEPIVSSPQRSRGRPGGARSGGGGPSRGYLAIVGVVVLLIVLLVVGLISKTGGGSSSNSASHSTSTAHKATKAAHKHRATTTNASPTSDVVALSLRASAPVYVCLIGDHGRRAIAGKELQAGETTSTYHARRFEITLGNSSVTMIVDGHARSVASSSQAIGYSITKAAGRTRLHSGQLPTCL
ncbi:MAG: cytoskeleton protein RodZ [Solirubrobacteraceae bacterium]|jgi:cytoskeletal protein RodZ|nr:cytoskeleton protein RodZ [Solirubrobacteraceae bacterium]